ncbi:MAG: hypothetical protein J6A24_05040 [Clostridia bacterium]|nr:hypothetical protein [Clostridia bacterium]
MKKKVLKIGTLVLALCLIGGILYLVTIFTGTPWGWTNAYVQGQKVIANHEGENYRIAKIVYDFKLADYYVHLTTPNHIDGDFTVRINGDNVFDNYERRVLGLGNTAARINEAYREQVDELMTTFEERYGFGTNCSGYGNIKFPDGQWLYGCEETDALSPNAVKQAELDLDKEYDVLEMARTNGYLYLSLQKEERSFARAAEILLNLKRIADEKGIAFYAVEFHIYKELEEGDHSWGPEERISVSSFLYGDIYEEGLAERIEAAHNAEMARIEEMMNGKENENS